ncbi:MAG: ligB [Herminiimonas sp.]|nr:ligB [Herminiimonas sp.]
MSQSVQMPTAFIGHGSPMNALENNRFTGTWRELGRTLPPPRAVLVISAHWFIHGSAVTAMQRPRVIHDFYGFPKELFEFDYPAPGDPDVAGEICDVVRPEFVALDQDSWGLDHGAWSVLAHVFPRADIPVVQLSVHAGEDIRYHYELGARLAPLRERGVFIIGSGNVVQNLRRVDWELADQAFDWAEDFDMTVTEMMTKRPEDLMNAANYPAYSLAVPTPEHFLPLAYLAGLASVSGGPVDVLLEGGAMGAITMTSFTVGGPTIHQSSLSRTSAVLPNPAVVPPQDTNT